MNSGVMARSKIFKNRIMELDGDYEGNLTIISSYSFYGEEIKVGELK